MGICRRRSGGSSVESIVITRRYPLLLSQCEEAGVIAFRTKFKWAAESGLERNIVRPHFNDFILC